MRFIDGATLSHSGKVGYINNSRRYYVAANTTRNWNVGSLYGAVHF